MRNTTLLGYTSGRFALPDRPCGTPPTSRLIREGMRADLVILSANPLTTAPRDLRELEVLTTIKDGEVVFEA